MNYTAADRQWLRMRRGSTTSYGEFGDVFLDGCGCPPAQVGVTAGWPAIAADAHAFDHLHGVHVASVTGRDGYSLPG